MANELDYFKTLTAEQYNNISILVSRMKEKGITNMFAQAVILAVISKESSFKPSFEAGYKTTSNERIKSIFSATRSMTDSQLNALKADPVKFFSYIYGGKFGNVKDTTDGYKYRGGGYNQITFKANYVQAAADSGVDLVSNPEKINDPKVAADAVIGYFLRRFKAAKRDINAFTDIGTAINDVYAANAGKLGQKITSDPTGGFAKTGGRAAGFYEYVKTHSGDSQTFNNVKANVYKYKMLYAVILLLIISAIIFAAYKLRK